MGNLNEYFAKRIDEERAKKLPATEIEPTKESSGGLNEYFAKRIEQRKAERMSQLEPKQENDVPAEFKEAAKSEKPLLAGLGIDIVRAAEKSGTKKWQAPTGEPFYANTIIEQGGLKTVRVETPWGKAKKRLEEETLRKKNYPLRIKEGPVIGEVSYDAVKAIQNGEIDKYMPKSVEEAGVLSRFKTLAQAEAKKERISSNPVFERYGIDPLYFNRAALDKWAKKHNMGWNYQTDEELLLPMKEGDFLGFGGKTLASEQEIYDAQALHELVKNNERKKAAGEDLGGWQAGLYSFVDATSFGLLSSDMYKDAEKGLYGYYGLPKEGFVSTRDSIAKTLNENKLASFGGNVAGILLPTGMVSKGVNAGLNAIKGFGNLAPWAQNAIADAITFGSIGGTRTAIAGGDAGDIAANAFRGALGGATGSFARSATEAGLTKLFTSPKVAGKWWTSVKNNVSTYYTKNILAGMADAGGDYIGDTAAALMTGKEIRSGEELLGDMAVAFIYGTVRNAKTSKSVAQKSREKLEDAFVKYADDYKALDEAGKKAASAEGFAEIGEALIKRGENLKKTLETEMFPGQKQAVENMAEWIDATNAAIRTKIDKVVGGSAPAKAETPAKVVEAKVGEEKTPAMETETARVEEQRPFPADEVEIVKGITPGFVKSDYSGKIGNKTLRALDAIGKKLGVEITIGEPTGKGEGAYNGKYENGRITIAQDAEDPLAVVLSHEVTHHLKRTAPAEYAKFVEMAIENSERRSGLEKAELIERYRTEYSEGKEFSDTKAIDEITADYAGKLVNDVGLFKKLVNADKNLAQRFIESIKRFIAKVKSVFSRDKSKMDTAAMEKYGTTVDGLEKTVKQYESMLSETESAVKDGELHNLSMQEAVEESRDLIAIHNASESQITEALGRGQFFMPSVAVTNKGLTEFGDISVIFNKSTIDPVMDSKNKLYGSDAWTPIQTELKKNPKFDDVAVSKVIHGIRETIGKGAEGLFTDDAENFKQKVTAADGSLYNAYSKDMGMQTAYAVENGLISEVPKDSNGNIDTAKLQSELDAVLDVDTEWRNYKKWLSGLSGEIITSYDKASDADIMKIMESQPDYAKRFKLSETGEITAPVVPYSSVEDFRRNKGRLSANAKADAEALGQEFLTLAEKVSKNAGVSLSQAVNAINNAFTSRYSQGDIVQSFKDSGTRISRKNAEMLQGLYKRAVELSTPYFEAKPSRRVGTEEISAVIIPDNTSAELRTKLAEAGIRTVEYEAGNKEDRVVKMNSLEDVKFSKKKTAKSSQFKNVDNKTPTENPDIRYSRKTGDLLSKDYKPPVREEQSPSPTSENGKVGDGSYIEETGLDTYFDEKEKRAQVVQDKRIEDAKNALMSSSKAEKKTLGEKAKESTSYVKRKFVNSGDTVRKIAKKTKDKTLYPAYNKARSASNAVADMIQNKQTNVLGQKVGESLTDIIAPIKEKGKEYWRDFQLYLLHKHNVARMSIHDAKAEDFARAELVRFIEENPFYATMSEAELKRPALRKDLSVEKNKEYLELRRNLRKAEEKNTPIFFESVDVPLSADKSRARAAELLRRNPDFAKDEAKVRKYIDNLMQYRIDSGLATQEEADYFKKKYPDYIPTYRDTEDAWKQITGDLSIGKVIGKAKGGKAPILPLDVSLGIMTRKVVRNGQKNMFANKLFDDYNANSEVVKRYITEVSEGKRNIEDDVESLGDGKEVRNTVKFNKDGKMVELTVTPDLYEAFEVLSGAPTEQSLFTKGVGKINDTYKKLITTWDPTFTVRNALKDLQDAAFNTRDFKGFAKNLPKAYKEIIGNGEMWQLYQAMGGLYSSELENLHEKGIEKKKGVMSKVSGAIPQANMVVEQATRLAEFMSVIEKGDVNNIDTLNDALLAAAEVTTNFGESGSIGKILNKYYIPFLNPAIQGTAQIVRTFTKSRTGKEWLGFITRCAVMGLGAGFANDLLMAMFGDDEDKEDYENITDRTKDNYYLCPVGDGEFIKLPKGRVTAALGIISDRIRDVAKGEDVDTKEALSMIAENVLPENPLNNNIFKAWFDADLFDEESPGRTWYGTDIESDRLQGLPAGERFDNDTDAFSKWIGETFGVSPKKLNYILSQYTGGIGRMVLPALTPSKQEGDTIPGKLLGGVTGVWKSSFTVDAKTQNKVSGEFYDAVTKAEQAKNSKDATTADKIIWKHLNRERNMMSGYNTKIRDAEVDENLTSKERNAAVRAASAERTAYQKTVLENLPKYRSEVEKYLKKYPGKDEEKRIDFAYREANRAMYGAEYAIRASGGSDVYKKALEKVKRGNTTWEKYYDEYFGKTERRYDAISKNYDVSYVEFEAIENAISKNSKKEDEIAAIEKLGYTYVQAKKIREKYNETK